MRHLCQLALRMWDDMSTFASFTAFEMQACAGLPFLLAIQARSRSQKRRDSATSLQRDSEEAAAAAASMQSLPNAQTVPTAEVADDSGERATSIQGPASRNREPDKEHPGALVAPFSSRLNNMTFTSARTRLDCSNSILKLKLEICISNDVDDADLYGHATPQMIGCLQSIASLYEKRLCTAALAALD